MGDVRSPRVHLRTQIWRTRRGPSAFITDRHPSWPWFPLSYQGLPRHARGWLLHAWLPVRALAPSISSRLKVS